MKFSECFPFERIQNYIFKYILGEHRKAWKAVNAELGSYPLNYLCYKTCVNTIYKTKKYGIKYHI